MQKIINDNRDNREVLNYPQFGVICELLAKTVRAGSKKDSDDDFVCASAQKNCKFDKNDKNGFLVRLRSGKKN